MVKPANQQRAARVLNHCDIITLRDEESLSLLKKMGVTRPRILLTADETLTLEVPSSLQSAPVRAKLCLEEGRYLVVSVRRSKAITDAMLNQLADSVSAVSQRTGLTPVLIPMHPDVDMQPTREFAQMLTVPTVLADSLSSIQEVMGLIRSSRMVIGMRMHTLVFAACCHVPFLGLAYDPKVESFVRRFPGLPCYTLENLSGGKLEEAMEQLAAHHDALSASIAQQVEKFRQDAAQNALLAKELLEETK